MKSKFFRHGRENRKYSKKQTKNIKLTWPTFHVVLRGWWTNLVTSEFLLFFHFVDQFSFCFRILEALLYILLSIFYARILIFPFSSLLRSVPFSVLIYPTIQSPTASECLRRSEHIICGNDLLFLTSLSSRILLHTHPHDSDKPWR